MVVAVGIETETVSPSEFVSTVGLITFTSPSFFTLKTVFG